MRVDKVIFVGRRAICREPMAMELLKKEVFPFPLQVEAKGLVVLFPEPINQKAEAIMISNGFHLDDYMPSQLKSEDFGEHTLILTFDQEMKGRILEMEGAQNVFVLTDVTGDELEILDPYGAELMTYGLCFETLTKTIHKLAEILKEE